MGNLLKENNAGGLSIERYDDGHNLISVFTGLEFSETKNGLQDLIGYGTEWDYDCAGGNTNGYHEDGNINGDIKFDTDRELNCYDVADDDETTKVVAEYDDEKKELKIYVDVAVHSASDYLNLKLEA